jgi:hypothetical protein
VIVAQAIAEYGAVAAIVAGVQHAMDGAQTWVGRNPTTALITLGALVLIGLILTRRRGSGL